MNQATLIGRVGADPEMRTQRDGSRAAVFRLATSKRWKDKNTGERKEKTEWHQIVVWSDAIAGVVENWVRKGSLIAVSGEIQTRKYQAQDGSDRYTTEIVLQGWNGAIELLGGSKSEEGALSASTADYAGAKSGSKLAQSSGHDDLSDDIPF